MLDIASPTEKWIESRISNVKKSVNKDVNGVYLAIIEVGKNQYDVEIEVDEGTVCDVYTLGLSLSKCRKAADTIEKVITENGLNVFKTRQDWENALFGG